MTGEPVDLGAELGEFGALVMPCDAIPVGELWTGPAGFELGDALRAFGPGTTAGGRAEAGWFMLGRIADDGLQLSPAIVDELITETLFTTHDGRPSH